MANALGKIFDYTSISDARIGNADVLLMGCFTRDEHTSVNKIKIIHWRRFFASGVRSVRKHMRNFSLSCFASAPVFEIQQQ